MHDGSNRLLSRMDFEALQARDGFQSRLVFQRAAECFYSSDLYSKYSSFFYLVLGAVFFDGFTQV